MSSFLLIALMAFAAHYLTRLVTYAKWPPVCIPREAFIQRWGVYDDAKGDERLISIGGQKTNTFMASLAYLWECDWCMGGWIAGALVYATHWFVDVPYPWLTWLGVASLVGFLAEREKRS